MKNYFWTKALFVLCAYSASAAFASQSDGGGLLMGKAMAHEAHDGVQADNPLANKVREMNARFADVKAATAEGYAPIPCVSGIDGGAEAIHYINGKLLDEDAAIDISKPEAVMSEPQADGTMQLVAVEYISLKGPANLDGHLFSFTNSPNRYGLPPFYE